MKQIILLQVSGLKTHIITNGKSLPIVDDVSFDMNKGETVGLVGESGCGKSMTALSLIGLQKPAKIIGGKVIFNGTDLVSLDKKSIREYRGKKIAMIFQEPMTSLNPVMSCGKQILEAVKMQGELNGAHAKQRVIELLNLVKYPDPKMGYKSYPHELSGGMRQRVMIAMALAGKPDLLIADEPTTALDVTVQAEIVNLLKKIQQQLGMAILFITHDIGLIKQVSDKIMVMYAGQIIEEGPTEIILKSPLHPYTKALLACLPRIDEKMEILPSIPGNVPTPDNYPSGCRFHPRCSIAVEGCSVDEPEFVEVSDSRKVRCPYVHHSVA
ncbi:MAG: ABC transporter ATP-binding protein [Candidatus Marinimicrobia bacterium]|nr:ABC transporter ATP-binding protein [Candidatus Neomarinimicrobiota bacterium]